MIVVTCHTCHLNVQVMGDPMQISYLVGDRSKYWPDKYACPRCYEPASAVRLAEAPRELLADPNLMHLEAEEMYAALNGLGLPDDRDANMEAVRDLLLNNKVTSVGVQPTRNPKRTHVDWLEFEDGTRMYLAAGGTGAVVYKIRRKTSYAERIDGESSS